MRRLARILQKRGIGSLGELTRTRLQACAPAVRLDDRRLTAPVRLLERYFEAETSLYPARPLSAIEQRVADMPRIWIRFVGWRRPPWPVTA